MTILQTLIDVQDEFRVQKGHIKCTIAKQEVH